tara:strand:- start:17 stop:244 length:228 start_codon:yes stop_codon:yes gene_type:complete
MKKGDEKVSVIAVANSRFTTEIKINTFIERKHIPLKQLNIKNLLPIFLNIDENSFVNKINSNKGITAATFLNKVN